MVIYNKNIETMRRLIDDIWSICWRGEL